MRASETASATLIEVKSEVFPKLLKICFATSINLSLPATS